MTRQIQERWLLKLVTDPSLLSAGAANSSEFGEDLA